jgi:hypothetical protein
MAANTDAIGLYFRPHGTDAVRPLERIAALRLDAAGLDAAVGKALQKIGSKDVLPAMALLLDSRDPEAQLRAAAFFAYFAKFGGNPAGAFDSPAVDRQMPGKNSTETPAEYAQFWKAWWTGNKESLGF